MIDICHLEYNHTCTMELTLPKGVQGCCFTPGTVNQLVACQHASTLTPSHLSFKHLQQTPPLSRGPYPLPPNLSFSRQLIHHPHAELALRPSVSVSAGKVSLKMLMVYVNAMGGKLRFTILMSWFLLVELCRVGATVWLSYWTGIADNPGAFAPPLPVSACIYVCILHAVCMCPCM